MQYTSFIQSIVNETKWDPVSREKLQYCSSILLRQPETNLNSLESSSRTDNTTTNNNKNNNNNNNNNDRKYTFETRGVKDVIVTKDMKKHQVDRIQLFKDYDEAFNDPNRQRCQIFESFLMFPDIIQIVYEYLCEDGNDSFRIILHLSNLFSGKLLSNLDHLELRRFLNFDHICQVFSGLEKKNHSEMTLKELTIYREEALQILNNTSTKVGTWMIRPCSLKEGKDARIDARVLTAKIISAAPNIKIPIIHVHGYGYCYIKNISPNFDLNNWNYLKADDAVWFPCLADLLVVIKTQYELEWSNIYVVPSARYVARNVSKS
jgi:hypothetical protein